VTAHAACKQQIMYLPSLFPGSQDTSSSNVPSISWLSRSRRLSKGRRLSGARSSGVNRVRSLQRSMRVDSLAEDEPAQLGRLTPTMTAACWEACAYKTSN